MVRVGEGEIVMRRLMPRDLKLRREKREREAESEQAYVEYVSMGDRVQCMGLIYESVLLAVPRVSLQRRSVRAERGSDRIPKVT